MDMVISHCMHVFVCVSSTECHKSGCEGLSANGALWDWLLFEFLCTFFATTEMSSVTMNKRDDLLSLKANHTFFTTTD